MKEPQGAPSSFFKHVVVLLLKMMTFKQNNKHNQLFSDKDR